MEKQSWKPIRAFLEELEPLKPIDTELSEKISKSKPIKALIFDIYGTLLISDSGDIDQANFGPEILQDALEKAGITVKTKKNKEKKALLNNILAAFKDKINYIHREKKENNIPFPEVNIAEVWEQVLEEFDKKQQVEVPEDQDLRIFSILFELNSNRVYPMPGMKEVLQKLKEHEYPLGVISNAQFYTPVIMNYFLRDKLTENEEISIFKEDLTFFSYKMGVAKPDHLPFTELKKVLKNEYNINPEEALFIGNDMYKDIYPAKKAGLQTALFAGDKRSLRLRKEYPFLNGLEADFVITKLDTILNILS